MTENELKRDDLKLEVDVLELEIRKLELTKRLEGLLSQPTSAQIYNGYVAAAKRI